MSNIKYDAGLSQLIESDLERISHSHQFTEGPAWHPDGYLLFSDIPASRICFWTDEGTKTYRSPSGNSNGLVFERERPGEKEDRSILPERPEGCFAQNGPVPFFALVACEHGNRRVSRTERDWAVVAIAERFGDKRLNSPNDAVVRSDGSVYFTDPPYGVEAKDRELDFQGVFRIPPGEREKGEKGEGEKGVRNLLSKKVPDTFIASGELALAAKDFDKPNGLAFSPDERILYIDDSGRKHIRAFDVAQDGTLSNGRVFAEMHSTAPGSPDGMKIDVAGRVWCAGPEGVWVFDPAGTRLGVLATPEKPSNCCWGDTDRRTLFITARSSVYRVRTKGAGVDVLTR